MVKEIRTSKKFVVGWGRDGKRIAFFIGHPELPKTRQNPIPCDPENLPQKMVELANKVDKARGKI